MKPNDMLILLTRYNKITGACRLIENDDELRLIHKALLEKRKEIYRKLIIIDESIIW